MAKEKQAPQPTLGKETKLPPIPKGAKVQKRPIMKRPYQSARESGSSSIIYVSSGTPFMSAVKRVRKKLDASLRTATAVDRRAAPKGAQLHTRIEGLKRVVANGLPGGYTPEPVLVMGTGRAIEKVVGIAGWFEQEEDCIVEIRTGTVGTVDDVVVAEDDEEGEDESRVRKMSSLEVSIRLK